MKSKSNARERTLYCVYLLLVLLLSVALVSSWAFRNYSTNHEEIKVFVYNKIRQQKHFFKQQKEALLLIDSVYRSIKHFNPELHAVYTENDIKNELKHIYSYYSDNRDRVNHIHYRVFAQTVDFYAMFLDDKKILQKKRSNVLMFKEQLQKCQIGFKESIKKMNLKAILQQGDKNVPQ